MTASCPLCHALTDVVLATKLRRGEGTVYHCGVCDLGFLVGPQDPDRYAGAYRQQVSHEAAGGAVTPQQVFDTYKGYQVDRLEILRPYLTDDSHVLEVGAGAGQFLGHLKDRCARRCAVEPDLESCAFMRGQGIEVLDCWPGPDRFDIACAFQVLEHVEDPVAFLANLRASLKPGGVAIVEVPNIYDPLRSVWGVKEYDEFYFHSDHRFYFSADALATAARAAGFNRAKDVRFTQDYSLLNHLSWLTNRKPQADCHAGMRPIMSWPAPSPIAAWVLEELAMLEAKYKTKLKMAGHTANVTMVLTT